MNKKLPHFFAYLSALGLSASTYAAEHWEGDWGDGWENDASKKTSLSTNTSSTRRVAPVGDSSAASAAASPVKKNTSSSYTSLSEAPGFLMPSQEAAPGASTVESFNPYADPILSFRWLSLLNGYPDPAKNYDAKNRQYYDASTGIFPTKQPQHDSLKNQVGVEMKTWETRVNSSREAYKTAYQDWQRKEERHLRKLREDIASATQQLATLTDSLMLSSSNTSETSLEDLKTGRKKEDILKRAKIDADHAERTFKELQRLFLAQHATECKLVADDARQLLFLTPEALEQRFIWGFIRQSLFEPYKTLPAQRHNPNNVKGFLLTDRLDIRIHILMLSTMIPHLEREYAILMDIYTRYKRDFVPQSTGGLLSPTKWSNWYYSTSVNSLRDELKKNYPSFSIAHFDAPKTDQEQTLRLLRRDPLSLRLRSKYLDHIKRYNQVENDASSEPFFKVYQGLDQVSEVETQAPTTLNKVGEQRSFPKPLSTPLVNIQTRYQLDPADKDNLFPHIHIPFIIPKKAQMASQYISSKAMGFHRSLWSNIMRELQEKRRSGLKSPPLNLGSVVEYGKLYQQYESLVQDTSRYLKTLQTADSSFLPTPFEFFFTAPPLPKQLTQETAVDLKEKEIVDQDLTNLRLLPGGKSEPVLHRYSKVNLKGNNLQFPSSAAFGPNLISLNVSRNQLRDLGFAEPLTNLTELDVSDQVLHNLSPFGNDGVVPLLNLTRFILAHTALSQIAPLAGFTSLKILDLSNNNIVTVVPLKDLTGIEKLNLEKNMIIDITDLGSLYNLHELNVSRNPLTNLKSTVKMEALQVLIANQCSFAGDWPTILPTAKTDSDPHLKILTHLQLKANDKIIWLPYQTKRSYNGLEVTANNTTFNISFPSLQVLEVGSDTKLETTEGTSITLDVLSRQRF